MIIDFIINPSTSFFMLLVSMIISLLRLKLKKIDFEKKLNVAIY
jgi:hypothetical protein